MSPWVNLMTPNVMLNKYCICKGCPSYVDCGESIGYCFVTIGKSKCIEDEMACICKGCPVYPMMGLTEWYFCTRDSEKVQKGG